MRNFETRLIGLTGIVMSLIYFGELLSSINTSNFPVSITFIFFEFFMIFMLFLYVVNNWTFKLPRKVYLEAGKEKKIVVIIPTWQEDLLIVRKTIESVFTQSYPQEKLVVILSDDSRNESMREMFFNLSSRYTKSKFIYNIPPTKSSRFRLGEGKAGNLNSAFKLALKMKDIEYIETRDADDLVGNKNFLRYSIAQLEDNPKLAYVQSIKTVIHSEGDPFSGKEELFYKSMLFCKNGANSVFPCGSALVWRKSALVDIGGFPTWNLVEDFQSGAEALRRGWKGTYIPIIGAIGQNTPEDIPNFYKQRGTWALDSFRFLLWGDKKGLNLRQRLHFYESAFNYFSSIVLYFYAFFPAVLLLMRLSPINTNVWEFLFYKIVYFLSVILFTCSLVRGREVSTRSIMRSLQTLLGLGPVYLRSFLIALINGGKKKTTYKVTRKYHIHGFYLGLVLPQLALVLVLSIAIYQHIQTAESFIQIDYINILWSLFFIFMHKQIITNSWFKFNPLQNISSIFSYKIRRNRISQNLSGKPRLNYDILNES